MISTVTDGRFVAGVVVGLAGLYVFHKFVKPVKGKGQSAS